MAQTDSELKSEVRVFTEFSTSTLDSDGLDTVVSRAKNHIRVKKEITEDGFDWYENQNREESLFWYACLFAKVATGQLDAQQVQIGAIDIDSLLAEDDDEVTAWIRNAESALRAVEGGGDYPFGVGITSPTREERTYGGDDTGTGTGTGGGDLGSVQ